MLEQIIETSKKGLMHSKIIVSLESKKKVKQYSEMK